MDQARNSARRMACAAGNALGVDLKFAARMLADVDQSAANRVALGPPATTGSLPWRSGAKSVFAWNGVMCNACIGAHTMVLGSRQDRTRATPDRCRNQPIGPSAWERFSDRGPANNSVSVSGRIVRCKTCWPGCCRCRAGPCRFQHGRRKSIGIELDGPARALRISRKCVLSLGWQS